jgi:hypothetical protein
MTAPSIEAAFEGAVVVSVELPFEHPRQPTRTTADARLNEFLILSSPFPTGMCPLLVDPAVWPIGTRVKHQAG